MTPNQSMISGQKSAPSGQRPYLILTLRRTGGTSLMSFLSNVSSYPTLQHEPFNAKRVWGHLQSEYKGRYDSAEFEAKLDEALIETPNIKHCFEITPFELSKKLILACVARNYKLFVLTRQDEVARLRSLVIAEMTGAWGPKAIAVKYPDIFSGKTVLKPVNLQKLNNRAERDFLSRKEIGAFLAENNIDYTELVFEEIYARGGDLVGRACEVAALLGATVSRQDPVLAVLNKSSKSTGGNIAEKIPNLADFERTLTEIGACFGAPDAQ